jgi:hypothetical protein
LSVDATTDRGLSGSGAPDSIEPQCLHLIAASWICSAQNGHFLMSNLLLREKRKD